MRSEDPYSCAIPEHGRADVGAATSNLEHGLTRAAFSHSVSVSLALELHYSQNIYISAKVRSIVNRSGWVGVTARANGAFVIVRTASAAGVVVFKTESFVESYVRT